jgi:hypothetical protein
MGTRLKKVVYRVLVAWLILTFSSPVLVWGKPRLLRALNLAIVMVVQHKAYHAVNGIKQLAKVDILHIQTTYELQLQLPLLSMFVMYKPKV